MPGSLYSTTSQAEGRPKATTAFHLRIIEYLVVKTADSLILYNLINFISAVLFLFKNKVSHKGPYFFLSHQKNMYDMHSNFIMSCLHFWARRVCSRRNNELAGVGAGSHTTHSWTARATATRGTHPTWTLNQKVFIFKYPFYMSHSWSKTYPSDFQRPMLTA